MSGHIPWNAQLSPIPQTNGMRQHSAPAPENTEAEQRTVQLQPAARRRKISTTIRLDADVLEWLREPGPGYQSRINAILRREMLRARKP